MQSELYFNLHKQCLSVRQNGIVEMHVQTAILTNVTFKVSEAGRQRVLREKQKNIHALLVGTLEFTNEHFEHVLDFGESYPIATYNPYKYASFVLRDDETPLFRARKVLVTGRVIYIIEP